MVKKLSIEELEHLSPDELSIMLFVAIVNDYFYEYLDYIKLLINAGASLEAKDDDGWTPLHIAAYRGNIEAIKTLICVGAALNSTDRRGDTPLHEAVLRALSSEKDFRAMMLNTGRYRTEPNAKNKNIFLDVIKLLIAAGANIDIKNNDGSTAWDHIRGGGAELLLKNITPELNPNYNG